MSVSRRRFLKHGAFAALACAAIPAEALSGRKHDIDGSGSGDLLHTPLSHPALSVNRGVFEGLVGSSFKVTPQSGGGSPVWLRLTAVADLPAMAPANVGLMSVAPPHSSPTPTTAGYILSLSAGGTSLTQDTYIFESDRMGKFPMFIVPAGPGQYTALFNLLNAPVQLAPSDDHPSPVHSGGPSSGAPAPASGVSSPANTGSAFGSSGAGSSRPAQQQLEPMFGGGRKTQMPE